MINEVVKCWLDLSRNLVVMNGCESRTIKKAEHQELMLPNCDAREDSWEFSDCMEIKPVNPKGNQPWIFIGRADAEAETPILWPPDEKSRLIGKDPDAGKDWGQEEKKVSEGEMAGSLMQWTWVWANSGRWWWTGRPGALWFMGSQRVGHDWATEPQTIRVYPDWSSLDQWQRTKWNLGHQSWPVTKVPGSSAPFGML